MLYRIVFTSNYIANSCKYDQIVAEPTAKSSKDFDFDGSHPTYTMLNDYQFQVYVGFIMYVTMVLAGLGMEFLVWRTMLNGDWNEVKEGRWMIAQL